MASTDKNAMSAFAEAIDDAVDEISGADVDEELDELEELEQPSSARASSLTTGWGTTEDEDDWPEWKAEESRYPAANLNRTPPSDDSPLKFELGEVVQMVRDPGAFFTITKLPDEGDLTKTYTMFGGRSGRGGVFATVRSAYEEDLVEVKTRGLKKKADNCMRAIRSAMAQAPKPHWKANGKK